MIERINLAPRKAEPNKIWAIIYTFGVVFFLIAGLVSYFVYSSTEKKLDDIARMTSQSAQSQDDALILNAQIEVIKKEIEKYQKQIRDIQYETNKLNTIKGQKHSYSKVLQSIAKELPESVKCNSISATGKKGDMNGVATSYDDLPAFVESLKNNNDIFTTVRLKNIGKSPTPISQTHTGYSFNIIFTLK